MNVSDSRKIHIIALPHGTLKASRSDDQSVTMPRQPSGRASAGRPAGTLPAGITFTNGVLSGTSNAATGAYPLTFSASNVAGTVQQQFTLNLVAGLAFTSPASTIFTLGQAGSFTVAADSTPLPTLALTGITFNSATLPSLPAGITFTPGANDGKGSLAFDPSAGTPAQGVYNLVFTATSGSNTLTQNFALFVSGPPSITSTGSATFTAGVASSYQVIATGFPACTFAVTAGTLPNGVKLSGSGLLSGTPVAGTGGAYTVTVTASNGNSPDATQSFTLTVNEAPAFTSANTTTFVSGTASTFKVAATSFPLISTQTMRVSFF